MRKFAEVRREARPDLSEQYGRAVIVKGGEWDKLWSGTPRTRVEVRKWDWPTPSDFLLFSEF